MTVRRWDVGSRLAKVRRTAAGGVRLDARLTRVGVFLYTDGQGGVRRELRLPDEVFAKDSLDTLNAAPVTDLHPPEAITPDNWRKYSVGTVASEAKQDATYVSAELVVNDSKTIGRIDSNEREEISCGYECDLETTTGVYQGERYDAIQRNIRYNHVALGPRNWGRAGSEVKLRLDSGDAITIASETQKETIMKTIKIDGIEYEVGTPACDQALAKFQARADAAIAENETLKADNAKLKSKVEETKDRVDTKDLDEKVKAKVALRFDASKLLDSDYAFENKSDRDIMVDAIIKADDKFDAEGKSDDYVRARFDIAVENATERKDALDKSRESNANARKDSKEAKPKNGGDDAIIAAKKKHQDASSKAWQQPLALSK